MLSLDLIDIYLAVEEWLLSLVMNRRLHLVLLTFQSRRNMICFINVFKVCWVVVTFFVRALLVFILTIIILYLLPIRKVREVIKSLILWVNLKTFWPV